MSTISNSIALVLRDADEATNIIKFADVKLTRRLIALVAFLIRHIVGESTGTLPVKDP